MIYLYSLLFIAFTACGSSEPVPPALSAYVNAQEALADDDFDKAFAEARLNQQRAKKQQSNQKAAARKKPAGLRDLVGLREARKPATTCGGVRASLDRRVL